MNAVCLLTFFRRDRTRKNRKSASSFFFMTQAFINQDITRKKVLIFPSGWWNKRLRRQQRVRQQKASKTLGSVSYRPLGSIIRSWALLLFVSRENKDFAAGMKTGTRAHVLMLVRTINYVPTSFNLLASTEAWEFFSCLWYNKMKCPGNKKIVIDFE